MISKLALSLVLALNHLTTGAEKPNIVLILADDLGYGDVSSYHPASKIKTPHIDALAVDGISFTDGHSNSAVCTPTRYGLLTGRYAWRTRLKRGVLNGYSPHLIEPTRATIASELKSAGYSTACIGKWHLGMDFSQQIDEKTRIKNGPNTLGFDYFMGITASLDMPPYVLIENNKFKQIPSGEFKAQKGPLDYIRAGAISPDFKHVDYLPDLAKQGADWIIAQSKLDQPFFLYLPLPAPHKPVLPNEQFKGKSGIGEYGDYVMETDWAVGEIINALKKTGEYENTVIIFTSDNGSFAVPEKYKVIQTGHKVNAHLRGQKTDIYEGGHRVPFIISWQKGYASNKGKKSDQVISTVDLFATIKNMVSSEKKIHADGVSFHEYLSGKMDDSTMVKSATIHHSVSGVFAIRSGEWKLIEHKGSGGRTSGKVETKGQLYNMKNDPSETTNLYDDFPEIVENLGKMLAEIKTTETK